MFSANSNQSGGVDATTDPYFNSTTLLLSGDGTNGAQNNTFIDSSTNNATITRNGTPTQGSFSPFSQTGWSGLFAGTSSDYINATLASSLGTGSFTIEFWFYNTDLVNQPLFSLGTYLTGIDFRLSEIGAGGANSLGSYFYNVPHADVFTSTNTWQHLAIVRSSGTITVYLNGSIFMAGFSDTNNYASTSLRIGGYQSGSTFRTGFLGYISNFRVVKGVAVYTGAFTPPTTTLQATQSSGTNIAAITGTATSLLTLQDNRFKDNALTPSTITVTGTPSVQAFSPFAPAAAYSLPATAAGSAYFNGSSYISVPDNVAFTMGAGDFTLEAWVYLTTSGASRMIFGTCDAAGNQGSMSYVLSVNASNNALFGVGYGGTVYSSTNTATVPTNQWVHIAGVRSGANVYVYLNGVQSTANTNMGALAITDSTQVVAIGRNGAGNFEYLTGYVSNARIVKGLAVYTGAFTPPSAPLTKIQSAGSNITALSGTETSLLTLQDSTFKDNSANALAITASATPPVIQSFTPFTQVWGGYFDGSSYLSVPATSQLTLGANDYTIECWFNITGAQSTTYGWGIAGTYDGASNGGWSLGVNRDTGAYGIDFIDNNTHVLTYGTYFLTNTWYHLALVKYGSSANNLKAYVNGIQVSAGTYNTADTIVATCYIGSQYTGQKFPGYISNFRVVKGTAVYTGAFTVPAKTLSATQAAGVNISAITGTATSLLTLQDPTFKDNAILPNTITATGTPKAQLVSAPFTSAATVDPVSGSGYFDGSSYLSVPDNVALQFATGDFTMELWFYPTATISSQILLAKGTGSDGFEFRSRSSLGGNYFSFWTANGGTAIVESSVTFTLNTWQHLAAVRSSGTITLYKNGVNVGSASNSQNFIASGSALRVAVDVTSGTAYSTGYISNIRLVKGTAVYTANFTPPSAPLTAITNTSLLTLQDTTFKDNSANALAITATGTPSMRAFTPFASNWGGYFNGTTDYLSVPSNAVFNFGAGAYTVEMWIYPTIFPTVSTQINIFQMGTHVAGGNFLELGLYNNAGSVTLTYQLYNTSYKIVAQTQVLPITNNWYHIAMIFTGSTAYSSLNGILSTGVAYSGNDAPTGQTVYIGAYNAGSPYFTGYISNLRIVKGTAVYTSNFTPPSAPLTAITNTSLLTLQNNTFIDNSANALAITAVGAPKTQLLQLPFTSPITKVAAPWNISVTAPLAMVGGSMYFDGSSYLSVPKNTALEPATSGAWTIEFFCYTGSGSSQYPWTYGNATISSGPDLGTYFGLSGGGTVQGGFYNGVNAITVIGGTVLLNQWNHVALVSNGTMMTLYLNGISVGTPVNISGVAINAPSSATGRIGIYASTNYFNGYISNFRFVKGTAVYTGNFTPPTAPPQPNQTPGLLGTNVNAVDGTNTSLLLLGSNAGIYDATAKNDIVTVGDTKVSSTQIKYGTGAMYFDGTGDYLNCVYSPQFDFGTGDFTVECWVYTTSYATAQGLFESRVQADVVEANRLLISILVTSGYPQLYNASNDVAVISTIAIPLNTWTHVAFTRNSGTARVFVNGQVGATNASFTTNFLVNKLVIGAMIQVTGGGVYNRNFFNGYIDDYRITKGVARYTTTFTPPTKAMIGQ